MAIRPIEDHEYFILEESNIFQCSEENTIEISEGVYQIVDKNLNANIPVNGFGVRVKSIEGAPASFWLYNITNFILFNDVTKTLQNPSELEGLKTWYDFTDTNTITQSSGLISSISDKSGNGNDLIASAGQEPQLLASGSNNQSYAKFINGKQLSKFMPVQGPYLIYMFFRNDEYIENSQILDFRVNGGGSFPAYSAGIFQQFGETGYHGFGGEGANISSTSWFDLGRWGLSVFTCAGRYGSAYANKAFNPNKKLVEPVTYPFPVDDFQSDFWMKIGRTAQFSIHELLIVETTGDIDNNIDVDLDRNIRNYFMDKYSPIAREVMMVSYGDSITEGFYATDYKGYVDKIANAKGWFYKNQGKSGSAIINTHNNGTDLLDGLYLEDKFDRDNILTFNHGANVAPFQNQESIDGYRTVINHFLSMGYKKNKIILISSFYQPSSDEKEDFAILVGDLAEELGVRFIDLFHATKNGELGVVTSLSNDGLHPNELGHNAIANYILTQITDL